MESALEWNKEKLVHFLETAPLYTSIEFEGKSIPKFDNLEEEISELSYYCPQCKEIRLFHSKSKEDCISLVHGRFARPNPSNDYLVFSLFCSKNDCRLNKRVFVYYTYEELVDKTGTPISHITLTKCGEYPSLPPRIDKVILKVFPKEAELLRKAIYCLNEGFGVGAFAYFRQALEDRIDVFIAEIRKYAEEQGDEDIKRELDKLHTKSKMSDIIDVAKKALPASLQEEGYNPLELLYRTLSDGVHDLSDSECLEKANAINVALTYILKTLAENSAFRKRYVDSLKSLSKKENVSAAEIKDK